MQKIGVIDKSFEKNSSLLWRECTNFRLLDCYCDEKEGKNVPKNNKNNFLKEKIIKIWRAHYLWLFNLF